MPCSRTRVRHSCTVGRLTPSSSAIDTLSSTPFKRADDSRVLLRRRDAGFALFLAAVQYKHCLLKLHRLHGAVCSTDVVFDDFQHIGPNETLKYLGGFVMVAALAEVDAVTKELAYSDRQCHQILLTATDPDKGFFSGRWHDVEVYSKYGMFLSSQEAANSASIDDRIVGDALSFFYLRKPLQRIESYILTVVE